MDYFEINTDWDENGNSPWDELWYDGDAYDLYALKGSQPLAAIWKSPKVRYQKRALKPDFFSFGFDYAVNEKVMDRIKKLVGIEAEFLPMQIPRHDTLFIIHPLWPIDFDKKAKVHQNEVSKNITQVHKYSFTFNPDRFNGSRHMFRMLQAQGSSARDGGYTLNKLIVSENVEAICEKNRFTGIVFKKIHTVS